MTKTILAVSLAILTLVVPRVLAQDKEKSGSEAKPAPSEKTITPLRVQVIFAEFEGDKKISNLPYTFLVNADAPGGTRGRSYGLACAHRDVQ